MQISHFPKILHTVSTLRNVKIEVQQSYEVMVNFDVYFRSIEVIEVINNF